MKNKESKSEEWEEGDVLLILAQYLDDDDPSRIIEEDFVKYKPNNY